MVSVPFGRALCWMLRPPGPVFSLCFPGWLLLQPTKRVVNAGEPIQLKCHSWRKTPVVKVQYFQNGRGKKYFHQNSDFCIPKAELEHSGSYFCRGIIGTKNESSEPVQITVVQGKTCAALRVQRPLCWESCIHTGKISWEEIADNSTDFFISVIHSET